MAGYLIAEEGPLSGTILRFEHEGEWVIGRDPDEATYVLEDPMVSRRHVIVRSTPEGLALENLSSVNPATQNGKIISDTILLNEGDILQIGTTFFRFTEKRPSLLEEEEAPPAPSFREGEDLSAIGFEGGPEERWFLKVITGPNAGAEFGMKRSSVYLIGKDPNLCDIIFQDLSVSRQHARLTVDEQENVFIEDLGSRNGVLVNGELISEKHQVSSQDVVALGTTTFLLIDREQVRETLIAAPAAFPRAEAAKEAKEEAKAAPLRDWKEMKISKRHLILTGGGLFCLLLLIAGLFSLFKTEPIVVHTKNEPEQIQESLKTHPDVQFSFTPASGKLFLVGHVLTQVDKQELLYTLRGLTFIGEIEDNVVVDEYVWQNMNALLITNPDWQGVSIYASAPGKFVMRGYLQTSEQALALSDFVNMNFPYLDRLDNQVVVENNLRIQIQSLLVEKGFGSVTFQLTDGELVLAGRVDEKQSGHFQDMVSHLKALSGVRSLKNFVVMATAESSRIDISDKYQVSGFSKKDATSFFVVINGRIVGKGDLLDGMTITAVQPTAVLLEKDGLKFRINYNLQ